MTGGRHSGALTAAVALGAIAVLTWDHFQSVSTLLVVLASVGLLVTLSLLLTLIVRGGIDRRRLGEENTRLAGIVRSSRDAMLSQGLDGRITAWNHGAEELFGYSTDEAIGQTFQELTVPSHRRSEADDVISEVLASGAVVQEVERVSKHGKPLEISLRAFPIRVNGGGISGVAVSAHDVTEIRKRERRGEGRSDHELWKRRIEDALLNDQFAFWGQPVIDVKDGSVHHHELLIRMMLNGNVVAPNEFLPHAEKSDLITEIDRWAIRRGIEFGRSGAVAINLSGKSLSTPLLSDYIRSTMDEVGAPPRNVRFEITETAAAENLEAAQLLVEQLGDIGCSVALDDFGTGYGSFIYLKHLPVRELKIDISFIRDLTSVDVDRRVVKSIIAVAETFGMETVAEGVEDQATLRVLIEMGVDLVQGYHLGRPLPMKAISASGPTEILSAAKASA